MNGDGRGGDRAFIPNPATDADAALASQLNALIASGSERAKDASLANLGQRRRSQRMPRPVDADAEHAVDAADCRRRFGGGSNANVYLQNVLAGVDQLVHGSNDLRGWGSPAAPDPTLLVPRGFDAANAAVQVRRQRALRRHASRPHAVPRSVPPRARLLDRFLGRLRPAAAAPRGRAGQGPDGLAFVAAPIHSPRSISRTRRAFTKCSWRSRTRCS